jgi:hypothetical protein
MIVCTLEDLPDSQERELRKWLDQPAYQILLRVIDAQVKDYQAKSMAEMIEAKDSPLKMESASVNLRVAQTHACFIEIIQGLAKSKSAFQIAKLS